MTRPGSCYLAVFAMLSTAVLASCQVGLVKKVNYSVRPMVVGPLSQTVTDATEAFAATFCAVLPHTDGGTWHDCARYLETTVPPQPPVSGAITTPLKVLIVGGAFSECFEKHQLYVFGESLEHLKHHGVVFGPPLSVGGTTTPEVNAHAIAQYLHDNPGRYLAIGHSKGAVDLMTAIQTYDVARTSIRALVSVAGAIGGTRLADLGVALGILGFRDAVRSAGLGNCRIVDHGGIESLSREVRYAAMRDWRPPDTLRSYSLVGVSSLAETSRPLQTMWKRNAYFSIDQDSHIIAEESVIPGGEFLGIGKGDHWALALPMSEHPKTRKKVDRNRFPRTALLEAIVRHVAAGSPSVTNQTGK